MADTIDSSRRPFLGLAALTMTAAPFGAVGSGRAGSGDTASGALPAIQPAASRSRVLRSTQEGHGDLRIRAHADRS